MNYSDFQELSPFIVSPVSSQRNCTSGPPGIFAPHLFTQSKQKKNGKTKVKSTVCNVGTMSIPFANVSPRGNGRKLGRERLNDEQKERLAEYKKIVGDADRSSLEKIWDDFGSDCTPELSIRDFERVGAIFSTYLKEHPDSDINKRELWVHILLCTMNSSKPENVPASSGLIAHDFSLVYQRVQEEHSARICEAHKMAVNRSALSRPCHDCNLPCAEPKFCARCRKASYCDRICQKRHWSEHKHVCCPDPKAK